MSSVEKLFWSWFVVSGVAIAYYILINPGITLLTGVLIGLVFIGLGILKLAQEAGDRKIAEVNSKIVETLGWIRQGLEKLNKAEQNSEVLAKKIIEVENRLSEIARTLTAEIIDIKSREVELVGVEKKEQRPGVEF